VGNGTEDRELFFVEDIDCAVNTVGLGGWTKSKGRRTVSVSCRLLCGTLE